MGRFSQYLKPPKPATIVSVDLDAGLLTMTSGAAGIAITAAADLAAVEAAIAEARARRAAKPAAA
jgi:hypothetical protein